MNIVPTAINGAFIIECEGASDSRGSFVRAFCARTFREYGMNPNVAQCNLCTNREKGTLRGLHYQVSPALESKLVRCTRGAIQDIIVDVRPESPTFLQHVSVELSADNRRALYVPPMCAHGYQTLTANADVYYQTGDFYSPAHERGLRYNDPTLKLTWPLPVRALSKKDASWPLLGQPLEIPIHSRPTRNLA